MDSRRGGSGSSGTASEPPGLWVVRRPRLHLGLGAMCILVAGSNLAFGLISLVRLGYPRPSLILFEMFWAFGAYGGVSTVLRARRALRDPDGETTRIHDRHRRSLSLPPERLARSARRTLAVLCLVPLAAVVLAVVTARVHQDRVFGWVLIGFAVLVVYVGAFVLHSPRLRSAGAGEERATDAAGD